VPESPWGPESLEDPPEEPLLEEDAPDEEPLEEPEDEPLEEPEDEALGGPESSPPLDEAAPPPPHAAKAAKRTSGVITAWRDMRGRSARGVPDVVNSPKTALRAGDDSSEAPLL
jgi:hypothetical protein